MQNQAELLKQSVGHISTSSRYAKLNSSRHAAHCRFYCAAHHFILTPQVTKSINHCLAGCTRLWMQVPLENGSHILYTIQIWAVGRPRNHLNTALDQKLLGTTSSVTRCVIMLVATVAHATIPSSDLMEKVLLQWLNVLSTIYGVIADHQRPRTMNADARPNHEPLMKPIALHTSG